MTNPVPITRSTPPRAGAVGPTIIATARCVISGAGFLPDHDVTIRVAYNAEDVSDYLTYTTDADGHLYAELHASPATGALHITATDHRTDPDAVARALAPLGLPVFVKPARLGSSVGIVRVALAEELPAAMVGAFSYDRKILIERYVKGSWAVATLLTAAEIKAAAGG